MPSIWDVQVTLLGKNYMKEHNMTMNASESGIKFSAVDAVQNPN